MAAAICCSNFENGNFRVTQVSRWLSFSLRIRIRLVIVIHGGREQVGLLFPAEKK